MNAKTFLKVGGLVLLLVGILGFIGVIGPTPDNSIFGPAWWFDGGENWAHLLLGIVGFIGAFVLPKSIQRPLVMLLGLVGVVVGVYSIFRQDFFGANLENPADTILHIVVGLWALLASKKSNNM